ncbi:double-stranded RNA-specific editase 1-like [Drosophila subpulchrella]|uniref:double-stranded RNA-specific editase 1-like n=1 Tax=Drosophila subpulchrella TaxID=1486046 RepID=UPI0018A1815F|nr:double-stranded RNA-specific editase 1-like [Drosophila subpulchrella]XP_037724449.1 double-stranded RNA-specific editase 1-like [Drosophila subpulchrella]
MKRTRRPTSANNKAFVSGGVYNPSAIAKPLIQQPLQAQNVQEQQSPPVAAQSPPAPAPVSELDAAAIAAKLPMPIIVKEEPNEVVVEEAGPNDDLSVDVSDENGSGNGTGIGIGTGSGSGSGIGGKIPFKKIFQKRKKSSERTRDKKQRQNRQLRKSMLPKNALMALNEVKGVTISDFTIESNPDGGFTAVVTVNAIQYEGKGLSKMSAKNAACEKAWRDFIIAKMTPKPNRMRCTVPENGPEPMEINEDEGDGPEDDLPMLNLASFAIYKLFAEWEREGYVVPEMHPSANAAPPAGGEAVPAVPAVPKEPKKPPVRTELPSGWETMHPATILCIMRPGLIYVDQGASGDKPNVMQHLGIVVDDQEFTASGRSKKIARRNVAIEVCNTLFGTNFSYGDTSS